MRHNLVLLCIVAGMGAHLAGARVAGACSHVDPSSPPYLVAPADGEIDVPLNPAISVHWPTYPTGVDPQNFHLRDGAGADVPLSGTIVGTWGAGDYPITSLRLVPLAPLLPATTYQLVHVQVDLTAPIGSFTSGTAADTDVPASPSLQAVDVGDRHYCGFGDMPFRCCYPSPVRDGSITVAEPAEPLLYSLREGDSWVAVDVPAPLVGFIGCELIPAFDAHATKIEDERWIVFGGAHELALTARDRAGNESAPIWVSIVGTCDPATSQLDAGTLPPGEHLRDGGCVAAPSRTGRPPLPLFAALVSLVAGFWRSIRRRALAIAALVAASVTPARDASACVAPSGAGVPYLASPHDGDVGVETNVPVIIGWPDPPPLCDSNSGCWPGADRLEVRSAGVAQQATVFAYVSYGLPPLTVRRVEISILFPRLTNARYDIVRIRADGTETMLGGFTTGTDEDHTPPARPEIQEIAVSARHVCSPADDGCCSGVPLRRVEITPVAASDVASYTVREGLTTLLEDAPGPAIVGYLYCDAAPGFDDTPASASGARFLLAGGLHELAITAVDRAGNESVVAYALVDGSCDPAAPDGGLITHPPDASIGGEAPPGPSAGGGGCAIATARTRDHRHGSTGALVFITVAMALGVRRRAAFALAVLLASASCASNETKGPACEVPASPRRIAAGLDCPQAIGVDGDHVYILDDGMLFRISKCAVDGTPELVFAGAGGDVVVNRDAAWVTAYQSVARVPADGSPPQVIATGIDAPEQLFVHGNDLYVSSDSFETSPGLYHVPADGSGPPEFIFDSQGQVFDLVGDRENLYVTGNIGGLPQGVGRISRSGGTLTPLDLGDNVTSSPFQLSDGGDVVYVTTGNELRQVPKDGGKGGVVAAETNEIGQVAFAGDAVYWTVDSGVHGEAVGSDHVATIVSGLEKARSLALDAEAVYVATCRGRYDGALWMVAR